MKRVIKHTLAACMLLFCALDAQGQDIKSILNGVLGAVNDKVSTLSETSLVGTWTYAAPECKFKSDNLLMEAGGEVASSKVEKKIAPIYKKAGVQNMKVTFADDNTFVFYKKDKAVFTGTYALDITEKTVQLSSNIGYSANAYINLTASGLSLVFSADKALELVQKYSSAVGNQNSTMQTISTLAKNYNGMQIGFELKPAN